MDFLSLLDTLMTKGIFSTTSLLLIIIGILIYLYKYFLHPIYHNSIKAPDREDLDTSFQDFGEDLKDELDINELRDKIEKLLSAINSAAEIDRTNSREILELRRDIEQIKQMLNQFQGHLMYSGGRRGGDFGNKELK